MKDTKSYTAPAVIASTDAVQNTKAVITPPGDGHPELSNGVPGTVGFYL